MSDFSLPLDKPSKPPVINIYCSSKETSLAEADKNFEKLKSILCLCLNTDRYLIYHLKPNQLFSDPWEHNTELLIVSSDCNEQEPNNVLSELIQKYLATGGKVLCFGASILHFDFVERKASAHNSSFTWSFTKMEYQGKVMMVPVIPDVSLTSSKLSLVPFNVLGKQENEPKLPLVISMSNFENGILVLSQAALDKDPTDFLSNKETFASLQSHNTLRFEVLQDLMSARLGLDSSAPQLPLLTSATLLSAEKNRKKELLHALSCKLHGSNLLIGASVSLQLVESRKDVMHPISAQCLPLVIQEKEDKDVQFQFFTPKEYWENLQTKSLGQLLLYVDVVSSTMPLLYPLITKDYPHAGLVAIAGRQTSGRGRGGNQWISPPGCAMFTLHVCLDAASVLGQAPAFLQHFCGLALVLSVRQLPGYEDINIEIKWSNDIVFNNCIKLGGVLVDSYTEEGKFHAFIGAGLNVSNHNPTMCINDLIKLENKMRILNEMDVLPELSKEKIISRTITTFEQIMAKFNSKGPGDFENLLYKYWIHRNINKFSLETENGKNIDVKVCGLDSQGHLSVIEEKEQKQISLNSLQYSMDVKQCLIFKKRT
ncbi:biotin--protein ligase [Octopus bimaculoides]|uniref:BPL/LPL catalytic domain-containing protein n=1 Tax=Octopus bimaculoides TaxID=37653 RepID=A0A0L8G2N0_OCTBM|nr:biotin--protein ligase [Octopus bimaculoides]XP_014784965.1 biotin--protein ligase [Octopus bimaculoides]XP_014784966.1 biotin--protein ligase [Octopus bimaculoides]XP_014784967.1 biotin--protein ligase [Octopus bimaculoides]XP_052831223.1 biotin--protein ligase [Octopus bimaculoides]XP_052831231.1 biotin--protein ligase [Octopus bimaculoides]|eukprot:XP_014784964.1 PREDICTED: biotin--protein ligase-like [Octopus bimaculoides]